MGMKRRHPLVFVVHNLLLPLAGSRFCGAERPNRARKGLVTRLDCSKRLPSTKLSGGLFGGNTASNPVSLFNRRPQSFRLRQHLKVPMVVFAGNVARWGLLPLAESGQVRACNSRM